jgi:pimeloyl-ACP methyl ester carboxylesterase
VHSFVRDALTFDVTDEGPADGRVVVLLHGFPEDRHCWGRVIPQLTAAGHRILAPDQRGYSPGARPKGRRAYAVAELTADILSLADVAGAERFDVVGHDWGAAVAWDLAARHPDRVTTVTALSVPPPGAFMEAAMRSSQILHSWYMLFFQLPAVPERVLRAAGPERVVRQFEADGLDGDSARRYARRMQRPSELTGPINWYRALPFGLRSPAPPVRVPSMLVWGDRDRYVTRAAVERAARHVTGPFRLEVLHDQTHWLPTGAADRVGALVLEHLAAYPS